MATTPQPHLLASWVTAFGTFDAAHGWGVNLFSVVALAAIGALFLGSQRRLLLAGVVAGTVLCLADWVLVQDFGFFGGVGTDPNSMVPMALVFIAGYLAVTRLPAQAPAERAQCSAGRLPQLAGTSRRQPCLHLPFYCGLGCARRNPDRDRSDGPRSDPPPLGRPGPGSSRRWHSRGLRLRRTCGQPGGPVRTPRVARKPARQGGRAHVPRPCLHDRLPGHRGRVPASRRKPSGPRPAASTSSRSAPTPSSSPRSTCLRSTARKASKECRTGCSSRGPSPSSNTLGVCWVRSSSTSQGARWSTTASSHT